MEREFVGDGAADREENTMGAEDEAARSKMETEAPPPPCPTCSNKMQWSDYDVGAYAIGWDCNNIQSCGSQKYSMGAWRWFCQQCLADICSKCNSQARIDEEHPTIRRDVPLASAQKVPTDSAQGAQGPREYVPADIVQNDQEPTEEESTDDAQGAQARREEVPTHSAQGAQEPKGEMQPDSAQGDQEPREEESIDNAHGTQVPIEEIQTQSAQGDQETKGEMQADSAEGDQDRGEEESTDSDRLHQEAREEESTGNAQTA
jgi:hypothetical protein